MSTKVENVVVLLKQTKPAEIAELPFVKDKFITIYNQIFGSDKGELIYHKESFNYKKLLAEKPELRDCSQLSLYGCFLDINVNGHSLEQGTKPDCYIIPRNFKTGKDDQGKDIWEKRATLQVSPYGELKMRMRAGQIKYADNPVIVYDCDKFIVGTNHHGKLVVKEFEKNINQPDGVKIIACFVRVERPDGSYEMPYLDIKNDVARLAGYSAKQNGKANALYSSNNGQIDTGFLMAKTLKHAMTSYPKVQTGKFTTMEVLEDNPQEFDYGVPAEDYSGSRQIAEVSVLNEGNNENTDAFKSALSDENEAHEAPLVIQGEDDEPSFA